MIIIVGHEKGGVGKSQIAFNLASLFSDLNTNVILVDTDPQQRGSCCTANSQSVKT